MKDISTLLCTRRFLPLFAVQFLGAFNDNLYKNALIILLIFSLAGTHGLNAPLWATLAQLVFILPFFLFSASAGQMADMVDKSTLIRWLKYIEAAIAMLGCMALYNHEPYSLLFVLFLFGMQAAWFGPVKYAILPEHLKIEEVMPGNALIEAGTFLAILLGTVAGGILIMRPHGVEWTSGLLMACSVLGIAMARMVPPAPPSLKASMDWNIFRQTYRIVLYSWKHPALRSIIASISWFWLVGAVFLSQFPAYVRELLGADASIASMFFVLFSLGLGFGGLLVNRLLKGTVSTRYCKYALFGISLCTADMMWASAGFTSHGPLLNLEQFTGELAGWRIIVDVFLIALSAGVYIVPLYTSLQLCTEPDHRARVIASNNIINAFSMMLCSVVIILLQMMGCTLFHIFLLLAVLNAAVAFFFVPMAD